MLAFYGDWQRKDGIMTRGGEYRKMDHYGPICQFEVWQDGKNVRVIPSRVIFEPEVAIGDFKLLELMCKELFIEFGAFDIYIPKLKRDVTVASADNIEEVLINALKELSLI